MKGNKELVKLLIGKGADIHKMDKYKNTALSWAAFHGHIGQAHHMFSQFLNLPIYEFFPQNFLCFVFLQGRNILLRSKMLI